MKWFLLTTLLLPFIAQADCSNQIEVDGNLYCVELSWLSAQSKSRGEFLDLDEPSPQLVAMREVPQWWRYSVAAIKLRSVEDKDEERVHLEGFRVFPYMHMQGGHHHGAAHSFEFDEDSELYLFSGVAFREMPGCWSLRWTAFEADDEEQSEQLFVVDSYANLSAAENERVVELCESVVND